MQKDCKVCFTTYIYGKKYQDYIPLLVYSCSKSYPEYDIILFLYEKLDSNIKKQLDLLNLNNIVIIENKFYDCPKMNPLKARSLRWVLWDDLFLNYDYLYIVDIDMLYIREPKPLHIQHIEHKQILNFPYDNIKRNHVYKIDLKDIFRRIKYAGFMSFARFLFGSKIEYLATGLHFVEIKPYYNLLDYSKREYYKLMIYNGSWLKYTMFVPSCDEIFLYYILTEIGLHPEKLAQQTDSVEMLDSSDTTRMEFRPHHGLHLGIFRDKYEDIITTSWKRDILESEIYLYYWEQYKQCYKTDPVFLKLISLSSNSVKDYIFKLEKFYQEKRA